MHCKLSVLTTTLRCSCCSTCVSVCRVFGSPSDDSCSELRSFPHWNAAFPRWSPLDLGSLVPGLSSMGVGLLEVRTVGVFLFSMLSTDTE